MENRAREARNAYLRAWRAKNKDRVKKYNRTYWERRAAYEQAKKQAKGEKQGKEEESE